MIPFHHMTEALVWRCFNAEWASTRSGRQPLAPSFDRRRALLTLLTALLAFLFVGCGAARPSKFYQLTIPHGTAADTQGDAYPVSILVGPLYSSHLYREDHIVYSSKGESMGTYEYERWVEPPTEMIQQVLFRSLRSSGRFRSVHAQRSSSRGDYLLHGHLYSFEEVTGSPMSARLALDLELRETKTGNTVWSHTYNYDEPVSGKNISAVVAALDHNVQRATDEITAGLLQYFSAHPPAQPASPAQ
jgi:ABC-type uncharacterized transport system auxiliary subunit